MSAPIEDTHGERNHAHKLLGEREIRHKHGSGIEGKKLKVKEEITKDSTKYDHNSCSSHLYQFYSVGNENGFNSKGKSNYSINMIKTSSCQGYVSAATLPDMFGPIGGLSLQQRQNRNYQICLIGFDHGLSSQRMSCKTFIEKTN